MYLPDFSDIADGFTMSVMAFGKGDWERRTPDERRPSRRFPFISLSRLYLVQFCLQCSYFDLRSVIVMKTGSKFNHSRYNITHLPHRTVDFIKPSVAARQRVYADAVRELLQKSAHG